MMRGLAALTACWLHAGVASGQSLGVEVTQSVGTSSESISAAGTQIRLLGEALPGLRWNVEGAWATRSRAEPDVFGTAYPYDGSLELIEAFGEYHFASGRGLRAIKGGRYRTPFGISSASDHAYIGFLRPPLIRYGEYFALSSGYLEHGLDVVVGVPRLSVEASVGVPADVGPAIRRPGVNTVVRAEGMAGALILGASFVDTTPYLPERFARGRSRFGGVDARWMKGGVLVRAERLAYDAAPPRALYSHRYSAGARIRLWKTVAASVGIAHQAGQITQRRRTAFDLGLTGSFRQDYRAQP